MFFSKVFSFAIVLATAAADLHNSCTCINGNNYNSDLTAAACSSYAAARYKWGTPVFDSTSGRCTGTADGKIAGDQWEEACRTIAQQISFPCPDGNGPCWATVASVYGSC